jgi:hypothetical protein
VSGRAMFLAGLGGDDDTQSTSATTATVLSMATDGRRGEGVCGRTVRDGRTARSGDPSLHASGGVSTRR